MNQTEITRSLMSDDPEKVWGISDLRSVNCEGSGQNRHRFAVRLKRFVWVFNLSAY
ncbi:hypothetical protein VPR01S_13_01000 [Vibrio proteolyticus NBRC 13287]|uniref:Uncharacterized protein n=1 Tax=Vibrio proteolyticus NBRC 13287 TaxID=1219065 RepID=U3A416_VIBPR|nr:hypothetical protein VPR01S_13_01000 [Vibrio proteolyticus NBRC 13287]